MPSPHIILSLDISTLTASIALVRDGKLIAEREEESSAAGAPRTRNLHLLEDIDALLRASEIGLSEVGAFAVAAGPGSFTGIRTGIATVKAFAYARARPVIAVPTLHAVARAEAVAHDNQLHGNQFVIASIPTGRSELFAQLLEVGASGVVREAGVVRHVTIQTLLDEMVEVEAGSLLWIGDGARKFETQIGARMMLDAHAEKVWRMVARKPDSTLARYIGIMAHAKLNENQADVNRQNVNPIYVRPAYKIQKP
ncbi:MAG: tRNA (adenosine(37)-N6)-threonylcarbamoyltransferase complex dimerization subunit type 1 TsaB [Pyrinomonadaceae bacterium MAG19_C2-C3]|nr:tRNA (adenosine(37)-N6)-threonylcarbamoyltransferase complex dimerization subunit type 1 TsaB [Pyrinomonadaceae bacterium MAG19_C2-C3]